MENVEGRYDGQPAIAGGGLHIDLLERSGVKNFSVGDAIERYAACKAQGAFAGARVQGAKHREEHFFEASLESGREVAMPLLDGLLGTAHGAESRGHGLRKQTPQFGGFPGVAPGQLRAGAMMREEFKAEAKAAALILVLQDGAESVEIGLPAVSRQAHHFVFIA